MRRGLPFLSPSRPTGLRSPLELPSLAAWYDASDLASMVYDGSNRVSLMADKSGNSAVNCFVSDGAANNYASTPDSVATSIVGDLDIIGKVALSDWTPAALSIVLAKREASGSQCSYQLGVSATTGTLRFDWSPDGTTANEVTVVSPAAPTVADFGELWVRVTFDVDNGAGGNDVKFYTSADGSAWAQLGATTTTAGIASIFNGTANVNVGANNNGSTGLNGRIYRAQIYNGIGGTLVFDANFATFTKLAATGTESSSNAATVTINTSGATGARICGARDLYQGTVANQPVLTIAASGNYLTFDGVDDYFKTGAAALAQPETVYACAQWLGVGISNTLFDGNANASAMFYQSTTWRAYAGADVALNSSFTAGVLSLLSVVFNSTTSSQRRNREIAQTGNAGTGNPNGLTVGARGAGGNCANITVSEIAIYSVAHATGTQDRFALYAGRKWGFAV